MFLESIIITIGWIMAIVPAVIAVSISFFMFRGAAKDDDLIMVFVIMGITIFLTGVGILVMFYLTDFGTSLIS